MSCELADDAIRGLEEVAAGQFLSEDELDAALGTPSRPAGEKDT